MCAPMGACTCVGGVVQAICIRTTIGMICTDSIYVHNSCSTRTDFKEPLTLIIAEIVVVI